MSPISRLPELLPAFHERILREQVDACIVAVDERPVYAYYSQPAMARRLHKVNSITKSVLSLLIGIALDRQAWDGGVSAPIGQFFPEAPALAREITVEQLLTMTPGWDWPEFEEWKGWPTPMLESEDWVRFVLERPFADPPGSRMVYNTGCSQVLSAILTCSTGMSAAAFAEAHLFGPLGIARYDWPADPQGRSTGGFGLRLAAADLLKLGYLLLRGGQWQGRRIVSADWIRESTAPRYHTYDHIGTYGYHWWADARSDVRFAVGFGGQFVIVSPRLGLTAVFVCTKLRRTYRPLACLRECLIEPLTERAATAADAAPPSPRQ